MNEIYRMIEEKIKASGYTGDIDGQEIYDEISDEISSKENGCYICMVKKEDDVIFEYHVEIFDEEFNLSRLVINTGDKTYNIDFD